MLFPSPRMQTLVYNLKFGAALSYGERPVSAKQSSSKPEMSVPFLNLLIVQPRTPPDAPNPTNNVPASQADLLFMVCTLVYLSRQQFLFAETLSINLLSVI